MNYCESVMALIYYIEENLHKNLTLEEISHSCHYSKYHLLHFFKASTGHSIMYYIRARKLSTSLELLTNSEFTIEYISSLLGFVHPTNFSRAFKRHYQLTPGEYRKSPKELPSTVRINNNTLGDLGNALIFQHDTLYLPAFHLVGIRKTILCEENKKHSLSKQLSHRLIQEYSHNISNVSEFHTTYGFWNEYGVGFNTYLAAFKADAQVIPLDKQLTCIRVPSNTYIVFKYIGEHSAKDVDYNVLRKILDFVGTWIANNDYSFTIDYHIEKVDYRLSRKDYCEASIYVPLVKRT